MSNTGTPRLTDNSTAFSDGCTHCGSHFSRDEWYPVVTESIDGDGKPALYSFCDDECKAAWSADD